MNTATATQRADLDPSGDPRLAGSPEGERPPPRRRAAAIGRQAARAALGICRAPHAGDARDLATRAATLAARVWK